MKAVFTGGGTGGHIYPALAVAQRFRDSHKCEILYIGSEKGMENKIMEEAGIPFVGITTDGFRSKNPISNIIVLYKLSKATKKVLHILKKEKPDFVFATGGYVSAPVAIAARILKIPLFLHEQNSIPGFTNKITSRFANIVFTTFENSKKYFQKSATIVWSGLPVRKEFYNTNDKESYDFFGFEQSKKTVLVTGGSGGALFLNKAALTLYKFAEENRIQLIHVTGKRDYEVILEKVKLMGETLQYVKMYPYLSNMHEALNVADFCISRAGAAFLSEMTFLGKTGIIIPFPYSANNHQLENARSFEKENAIMLVEEKDMERNQNILREKLAEVIFDDEKIKEMKKASYKLGARNTLEIIEKNILKELGAKI